MPNFVGFFTKICSRERFALFETFRNITNPKYLPIREFRHFWSIRKNLTYNLEKKHCWCLETLPKTFLALTDSTHPQMLLFKSIIIEILFDFYENRFFSQRLAIKVYFLRYLIDLVS